MLAKAGPRASKNEHACLDLPRTVRTVTKLMRYFLLLAVLFCSAGLRAAQPGVANGIAVIVNDAVITYKDVFQIIRDDVEFLERRYAGQPQVLEQKIRELQEERIEILVNDHLVLHEFKTAGYQLPETWIENRIEDDIKKYGDRLTLTKTLQAQGITFETYRTKVRERTILEVMWRQKVPNDPLISPAKIEKFYLDHQSDFKMQDQVKLRMIVLTNRPNDSAYSPAKVAGEILDIINKGASFAEMAQIYSQGSQAREGGDWGWVEHSVLREELAKAAFALKPGEHSGVIETPQAVYLMKVEDARPAHVKSLSEVRDEIEAKLRTDETRRLRKQWIDRLKAKAFIRYF
ncbi:MAG: peptidyl-prolyl cis-trans isomerase [Verrucomicrobiota bacterium]|nr:peptidyl-prolyl cis-trans isomerase [Verrucomicrobiota bacterium]